MIKCEVIKEFTLERYNELKNIQRRRIDTKGKLYVGDTFECDEKMADYLMGDNKDKQVVVRVIEVEPEKEDIKVNINLITELNGKEIAKKVIEYQEKAKSNKKKKSSKK